MDVRKTGRRAGTEAWNNTLLGVVGLSATTRLQHRRQVAGFRSPFLMRRNRQGLVGREAFSWRAT
jgi:hypothetical protein